MNFTNPHEIRTPLHAGDVVWAFAYRGGHDSRDIKLRQRPVRGMLTYAPYDDARDTNSTRPARYFIPFGKTGQPMWSKTVSAVSRKYAADEIEAIKGYNAEIEARIAEKSEAIDAMRMDMIPVTDESA